MTRNAIQICNNKHVRLKHLPPNIIYTLSHFGTFFQIRAHTRTRAPLISCDVRPTALLFHHVYFIDFICVRQPILRWLCTFGGGGVDDSNDGGIDGTPLEQKQNNG